MPHKLRKQLPALRSLRTAQWTAAAPAGGALEADLLVVAASEAACALVDGCLAGGLEQVGALAAPPAPEGGAPGAGAAPGADLDVIYGGSGVAARPRARDSEIYRATAAGVSGGSTVVICCRGGVAPEAAPAWARAALGAVRPKRALIVGAISGEHYRGAGDASQDFLVFSLATSAARKQQQQQRRQGEQQQGEQPPPPLPSGSVVPGLPAALLAECELRGVAARLVVSVDQVPALLPDSVPALASAAAAALLSGSGGGEAGGGAGALAAALTDGARVAAARAALGHHAARVRGSGSVYA